MLLAFLTFGGGGSSSSQRWIRVENALAASPVLYSASVVLRGDDASAAVLAIGGCTAPNCKNADEMAAGVAEFLNDAKGRDSPWAPLPMWHLHGATTKTQPFPDQRRFGAAAAIVHYLGSKGSRQVLYLIGGTNRAGSPGGDASNVPLVLDFNDCEQLKCAWTPMKGLRSSHSGVPGLVAHDRVGHTVVTLRNSVYVIGGAVGGATPTQFVEMLTPNASATSDEPELVTHHCCGLSAEACAVTNDRKTARVHHASAAWNGTIYVFGGLTQLSPLPEPTVIPAIAWTPPAETACAPGGGPPVRKWTLISNVNNGYNRWGFSLAMLPSPSEPDVAIALALGGFLCDNPNSCPDESIHLAPDVFGWRLGGTPSTFTDLVPKAGSRWTTLSTARGGLSVASIEQVKFEQNKYRIYALGGSNNSWVGQSAVNEGAAAHSLLQSLEYIDLEYADLDPIPAPAPSPAPAPAPAPASSDPSDQSEWLQPFALALYAAVGALLCVGVLGVAACTAIGRRRRRKQRSVYPGDDASTATSTGVTSWLLGAHSGAGASSSRSSATYPGPVTAQGGGGGGSESSDSGGARGAAASALEREYGALEKTRLLKHESFIDPSRITVVRKIAKGGCGEVWLGKYSGNKVVLKALFKSSSGSDEEEEFWHEAEMLSRMSHPQVVRFFGVTQKTLQISDASVSVMSDRQLFIVMEYCKAGSIGDAVKSGTYDRALLLMRHVMQIATALDWLHSQGVVHRDVKPGNVLLSSGTRTPLSRSLSRARALSLPLSLSLSLSLSFRDAAAARPHPPPSSSSPRCVDGSIKLCDLGISRQQPGAGETGQGTMATMTVGVGTVQYMPPELLSLGPHATMAQLLEESATANAAVSDSDRSGRASEAAGAPRYDGRKWDVYGLAMIIAYLWDCDGKGLYPGLSPFQVAAAVASGHRPRLAPDMPELLQQLVARMWADDPRVRPSAAEVAKALGNAELQAAVRKAL